MLLFICAMVILISCTLTRYMIYYAQSHQIIDQPNYRSLHTVAVPRGAGIAVIFSVVWALPFIHCAFGTLPAGSISLILITAVVTLIGFLDDCWNLSSALRFAIYAVVCTGILYSLGGMPVIYLLHFNPHVAWMMQIIGWIYLLWMVNLYNFMDGINGLAASEAICVCIGGVCLYLATGHSDAIYIPLIVAAASLGFLVWNFPVAQIFMGDSGSCSLGLILAGLSIQAGRLMPELFWAWLILLGVFIVDGTYTVLCRALQGLKIYQAHRSHAYQHAAARFGHARVTFIVILINLIWLFPVSALVGLKYLDPILGIILAYIPLTLIAFRLNAGRLVHLNKIID